MTSPNSSISRCSVLGMRFALLDTGSRQGRSWRARRGEFGTRSQGGPVAEPRVGGASPTQPSAADASRDEDSNHDGGDACRSGGRKSLPIRTMASRRPQRASSRYRPSPSPSRPLVRAFAWLCIVAGIGLAIAAFVIAANKPTINPWPSLVAGFCVTAAGMLLLMMEKQKDRLLREDREQ